jgi:hypothetical protein
MSSDTLVSGGSEKVDVSPSVAVSPELLLLGRVRKCLLSDPHAAYTAGDLLQTLKLLSPKDPEKQAGVLAQVQSHLLTLFNEGLIREVAPLLYKTRLFFDAEKNIEHAFIGGMGNVFYSFSSPVFRLNIGVISLFFLFNEKQKNWRVCVSDTTIGRNYSLVRSLSEGAHIFGTNPKKGEGKTSWIIDGKYIEKTHMTLTLSVNRIEVEDHRTLQGTRINHFTDAGLIDYLQVGRDFLGKTDSSQHKDVFKRGQFALEQLLHLHKNYEVAFFTTIVDFLLIQNSD